MILKKNTVLVDAFNRVVDESLNPTHKFKSISLEALGDWAYEQLEHWDIQDHMDLGYRNGHIDFAKRVADSCLGEKEVKKRWNDYLKKKELEKKQWEKQKQEVNLQAKKQEKEFEKYFVQKQGKNMTDKCNCILGRDGAVVHCKPCRREIIKNWNKQLQGRMKKQ